MESDGDYYCCSLLLYIFTDASIDYTSLFILLFIALLLFVSAVISGSEVAFFSLNANDRKELSNSEKKYDSRILNLIKNQDYLLATILISNNIINIAIVILSYFALRKLLTFNSALIETLVNVVAITFVLVLFGEIIPKLYARNNRMKMATFASTLLTVLSKLLLPFSFIMVNASDFIQKKLPINTPEIDIDELEDAIDLITDNSDLSIEDNKMLKGIINFGNINSKQVMRSRVDMLSIENDASFEEVYNIIIETGFSRIPVFKENLDNIIGILYAKDILEHLDKSNDFNWNSLLRKPFFIPESKKIDDLLKDFQKRRMHLAIVVDEYGGTSGLITLEDVVEQVIGEIQDEYDDIDTEIHYKKLSPSAYCFEGKTLINDLCKVMDIAVDEFDNIRGESDSLAGLILEINGRMPDSNEEISFGKYKFNVKEVNDNRIEEVVISIVNSQNIS